MADTFPKLDILAIVAHPDDAELGCGGTLIKHARAGYKVGVVDLTEGELGTRGTPEERRREAEDAARIMGLAWRENLGMADGFFRNDEAHRRQTIAAIRRLRPEIVITNALDDRHPDHGRAARLVADSAWLSGLRKIEAHHQGQALMPWRPRMVLHFIQYLPIAPNLLVDIKDCLDEKMRAIKAYRSQFHDPESSEPETLIASAGFLKMMEAKAMHAGNYGLHQTCEGFSTKWVPTVKNLFDLSVEDA